MKTPRITDFDPDVKVPNLKSSLDKMPAIQKPHVGNAPAPSPAADYHDEQRHISKNTTPQPNYKPVKRPFVRRTFDFYEDQITYLIRHSLQQRLDGREISMNEMVREAIDDWIYKNTSK